MARTKHSKRTTGTKQHKQLFPTKPDALTDAGFLKALKAKRHLTDEGMLNKGKEREWQKSLFELNAQLENFNQQGDYNFADPADCKKAATNIKNRLNKLNPYKKLFHGNYFGAQRADYLALEAIFKRFFTDTTDDVRTQNKARTKHAPELTQWMQVVDEKQHNKKYYGQWSEEDKQKNEKELADALDHVYELVDGPATKPPAVNAYSSVIEEPVFDPIIPIGSMSSMHRNLNDFACTVPSMQNNSNFPPPVESQAHSPWVMCTDDVKVDTGSVLGKRKRVEFENEDEEGTQTKKRKVEEIEKEKNKVERARKQIKTDVASSLFEESMTKIFAEQATRTHERMEECMQKVNENKEEQQRQSQAMLDVLQRLVSSNEKIVSVLVSSNGDPVANDGAEESEVVTISSAPSECGTIRPNSMDFDYQLQDHEVEEENALYI